MRDLSSAASSWEQIVNDGFLYLNGCQLAYASATTITANVGQLRDSSNTFDIFENGPLNGGGVTTISTAFVGVNGLDKGTVAASTVYRVYAIWDLTNKLPGAFLLSTSSTAPTMPPGYSSFSIIGTISTDGSSNINKFYQGGSNVVRTYIYDAPITVATASVTGATPTSLASAVPPVSGIWVLLKVSFTPNVAGDVCTIYPSGSASTGVGSVVGQVAAIPVSQQVIVPVVLVSGVPKFDYLVSSASDVVSISVLGFTV